MRIGIDLDNTLCNTSTIINELASTYATSHNINQEDIFSNIEIKDDFFIQNMTNIFKDVPIKNNASEVLRYLKEKGHELYVITARSNHFTSKEIDIIEPTMNWLNNHKISIDKIITDSYGIDKATTCLDNKIDIMIDDDLHNIEEISKVGIKCILFDDNNKYNIDNRVTNWLEVKDIIERNE